MFCTNCGQALPPGAQFCAYCGTPTDTFATPAQVGQAASEAPTSETIAPPTVQTVSEAAAQAKSGIIVPPVTQTAPETVTLSVAQAGPETVTPSVAQAGPEAASASAREAKTAQGETEKAEASVSGGGIFGIFKKRRKTPPPKIVIENPNEPFVKSKKFLIIYAVAGLLVIAVLLHAILSGTLSKTTFIVLGILIVLAFGSTSHIATEGNKKLGELSFLLPHRISDVELFVVLAKKFQNTKYIVEMTGKPDERGKIQKLKRKADKFLMSGEADEGSKIQRIKREVSKALRENDENRVTVTKGKLTCTITLVEENDSERSFRMNPSYPFTIFSYILNDLLDDHVTAHTYMKTVRAMSAIAFDIQQSVKGFEEGTIRLPDIDTIPIFIRKKQSIAAKAAIIVVGVIIIAVAGVLKDEIVSAIRGESPSSPSVEANAADDEATYESGFPEGFDVTDETQPETVPIEEVGLADSTDPSFEQDMLSCFTADPSTRTLQAFNTNLDWTVNLAVFNDSENASVFYIAHKTWMVFTEGDNLNIRSGPSKDVPVIGQYADGDLLESTGRIVVAEDGTPFVELGLLYSEPYGWVSGEYVIPFFDY
jgi:hypothetical protein